MKNGIIHIIMVAICLPLCAFAQPPQDIDLDFCKDSFAVNASTYRLAIDPEKGCITELRLYTDEEKKYGENILGNSGISIKLETEKAVYSHPGNSAEKPCHIHVTRRGPYLAEIYIENIIINDDKGDSWDGLAELTLYCQQNRIGIRASVLVNHTDSGYIIHDDNRCCYKIPEGFDHTTDDKIKSLSITAKWKNKVSFREKNIYAWEKSPICCLVNYDEKNECILNGDIMRLTRYPTKPSQISRSTICYEIEGYFAIDETLDKALDRINEPILSGEQFQVTQGKYIGYNQLKGAYEIRGINTGGKTERGVSGGARFRIRNGNRKRSVLVDQIGSGWLRGAVVRDDSGKQLPVLTQQNINFPELGKYGERGWGFLTYPIDLDPGEAVSIHGEELYLGYGKFDQISLCWLENVGNPPLVQTSVAVVESHTTSISESSILRFNDFRRYKTLEDKNRSISCVGPTFFRYRERNGTWHDLYASSIKFLKTGPLFVEYLVTAFTDDKKIKANLRLWQIADNQRTRVFVKTDINVVEDIFPAPSKGESVRFAELYTFNPMAYRTVCFSGSSDPVTIDFGFSGLQTDGIPIHKDDPFVALYNASNPLDQGIPCSDLTGNPGAILIEWMGRINDLDIPPGFFLDARRPGDAQFPYGRWTGFCLNASYETIPAGSRFSYLAEFFVYGKLEDKNEIPEGERMKWGLNFPRIVAAEGEILNLPYPVIKCSSGSKSMEFSVFGGDNLIPVILEDCFYSGNINMEVKQKGKWEAFSNPDTQDFCQLSQSEGSGSSMVFLLPASDNESFYRILYGN